MTRHVGIDQRRHPLHWEAWLLRLIRAPIALTAGLVPHQTSYRGAIAVAALAGMSWLVTSWSLAAFSADDVGASVLVAMGASIGFSVMFGLAIRGWAQADIAHGAVLLGERPGLLLPTLHRVPRASRLRHLLLTGGTGSGKSTLLQHLACQDAAAPGRLGLLCIDIKDDLAPSIAARLPASREDDVLLFDPADTAYPPAFNPLASVPAAQRTLTAAELVAAFRRLYGDAWGPRLEHVLRAVLLTLLEVPEATMLDIVRLLTDGSYRSWAVSHVTNFSVHQFWAEEFPAITGARGSLANVESILNKLGVFAYPEIRNVLGQPRRGLDVAAAMAEGRIVLVHPPQGVLGEDAAHFLAALLVGTVQVAAQRRVTQPPSSRRPFYLFADEVQNYETSALTKLITEGRAMGVGVVAACQFPEQLAPPLRRALERNCAYALTCRLIADHHLLEVRRPQELEAPDASILLWPPRPPRQTRGQAAAIRARSRRALAVPRAAVEAAIARGHARSATARGCETEISNEPPSPVVPANAGAVPKWCIP